MLVEAYSSGITRNIAGKGGIVPEESDDCQLKAASWGEKLQGPVENCWARTSDEQQLKMSNWPREKHSGWLITWGGLETRENTLKDAFFYLCTFNFALSANSIQAAQSQMDFIFALPCGEGR